MKNDMSGIEQRVLGVIQKGLPKCRTPYKDMARQIGVETSELLAVLRDWKKQGKLRRIGAIVNHLNVGLPGAAMVVWRAESERIVEVGQIFAGFEEISHAYERQTCENWPYNIYTMVHARSAQDVHKTVKRMSKAAGVSDYRILFTEEELKKVPPTYIMDS